MGSTFHGQGGIKDAALIGTLTRQYEEHLSWLGTGEGSRQRKSTEMADGRRDEKWHKKTGETKTQALQKQTSKSSQIYSYSPFKTESVSKVLFKYRKTHKTHRHDRSRRESWHESWTLFSSAVSALIVDPYWTKWFYGCPVAAFQAASSNKYKMIQGKDLDKNI